MAQSDESGWTYLGWLPCISGRVIFHCVDLSIPCVEKTEISHVSEEGDNVSDPPHFVIVSSTVDWKDSDGPHPGTYRVFLLGRRNYYSDHLEGFVFLLPLEDKNPYDKETVDQALERANAAVVSADHGHSEFALLFERLVEALESCGARTLHRVDFLIEADGITKFTYAYTSPTSKEIQISRESGDVVVRQVFYYTKYTFHKHKHHDPSADSLTTTHRLSSDEAITYQQLVDDLRDGLVDIARKTREWDHDDLYEARGIALYGKSLVRSCRSRRKLPVDAYEGLSEYFDNFERSLASRAEHRSRILQKADAAWSSSRSIVLLVLAIVGPALVIYRKAIQDTLGEEAKRLWAVKFGTAVFSSGLAFSTAVVLAVLLMFVIYLYRNNFGTMLVSYRFLYENLILATVSSRWKTWRYRLLIGGGILMIVASVLLQLFF